MPALGGHSLSQERLHCPGSVWGQTGVNHSSKSVLVCGFKKFTRDQQCLRPLHLLGLDTLMEWDLGRKVGIQIFTTWAHKGEYPAPLLLCCCWPGSSCCLKTER